MKGSFHASTAGELRFADGAVFSALDTAGSTLGVAEPAAFGFLGANIGRIDVAGSTLVIRSGEALSLSAGDIGLSGATIRNAPPTDGDGGGVTRISLAAQRSAGDVPVDTAAPAVARDGSIRHAAGETGAPGVLRVDEPGGGRIRLEGGDVVVDQSNLLSINTGALDATGGVEVAAARFTLQRQSLGSDPVGVIVTSSADVGRAAPIRLSTTKSVDILGGFVFSAANVPAGGGGAITVDTGRLTMTGGVIGAPGLLTGPGYRAPTQITAREFIALTAGASIFSASQGEGPAGAVNIRSDGPITLEGGSQITASTLSTGAGGALTVAARSLSIDNSRITSSTYQIATGAAGSIDIDVTDHLQLANGGLIASSTFGVGYGGPVDIAAGSMAIDGRSRVQATAGSTDTGPDTGPAGSIKISAADLALSGGGQIVGSTYGTGKGGSVEIDAGTLVATGGVQIGTGFFLSGVRATAEQGSAGSAGLIDIHVDGSLALSGGGQITSSTFSTGGAAGVTIDSAGSVLVSGGFVGEGVLFPSAILATSELGGAGGAGSIKVTAVDRVELSNGGQITSSTSGTGNGGTVEINAGAMYATRWRREGSERQVQLPFLSGVRATAEQGSAGSAGLIDIHVDGSLALSGGGQITSSTFSTGGAAGVTVDSAGSVLLSGGFVGEGVLFPSAILATSELGAAGAAGSIKVTAVDRVDLSNGGLITSSTSGTGNGGTVEINAGAMYASGSISSAAGSLRRAASRRPPRAEVRRRATQVRSGSPLTVWICRAAARSPVARSATATAGWSRSMPAPCAPTVPSIFWGGRPSPAACRPRLTPAPQATPARSGSEPIASSWRTAPRSAAPRQATATAGRSRSTQARSWPGAVSPSERDSSTARSWHPRPQAAGAMRARSPSTPAICCSPMAARS